MQERFRRRMERRSASVNPQESLDCKLRPVESSFSYPLATYLSFYLSPGLLHTHRTDTYLSRRSVYNSVVGHSFSYLYLTPPPLPEKRSHSQNDLLAAEEDTSSLPSRLHEKFRRRMSSWISAASPSKTHLALPYRERESNFRFP